MQYFIGYTSFTTEPPFDASLFVEFRKRLTLEHLNELNEKIILLKICFEQTDKSTTNKKDYSEEPPTSSSTFFKKKVYFEEIISIRESRRRQRVYINLKFRQNNKSFSANFFQAVQYNALEMIKEKLIFKGKSDCIL